MQSPPEDGFSPLNYSDFVNDAESLHMFNTDSPAAGSMSIDPHSIFLTTDVAASPLLNSLAPHQPSTSKPPPTQFLTTDTPGLSFTNSPRQPRSTLSSASPESSTHDSSSDSSGRRKRKSPDSSSPSAVFGSYTSQTWARNANMDMKPQNSRKLADSPLTGEGQGQMQDLDPNMQFINSELQNNFDFNSAASSPKGFAVTPVAGSARAMKQMPRSTIDQAMPPIHTTTNTMFSFGSRDHTPPSATFAPSYQTSPSITQADYSVNPDAVWPGMRSNFPLNHTMISRDISGKQMASATVNPSEVGRLPRKLNVTPQLHVNPIPIKSRVETQISIKLTLDPLPQGVTKLHLPTHSISKAKLLAKEVIKTPDTLELSTMLVCTSAMQNSENKARALRLARSEEMPPKTEGTRRSSTGDSKKEHDVPVDPNDPNLPQNGAEVKICDNCINRERKRAARKKQRKQEEEDIWNSYERDRVVVFNTTEYQNFHTPTPLKDDPSDNIMMFSDSAMQIDAPMRIACYCRHMNEKIGFQVIFTIKDHEGKFVAQTMTQSIHITDDHKTHGPTVGGAQDFGFTEQNQYGLGGLMTGDAANLIQGNLPHRQYHSTTDLTALSRTLAQNSWTNSALSQSSNPFNGPNSSALSHNRALSRPASPSAQIGPKKKRKGSTGHNKLPPNLMMTRADQPQPLSIPDITSGSILTTATGFSPDGGPYTAGPEPTFRLSQGSLGLGFHTGPPTPSSAAPRFTTANRSGSTDNLNSYFYSAPNSAHPSRAASPTSFSRAQMAFNTQSSALPDSTTAASIAGVQMNTDSHRPQPIIHRILPPEGPKAGGIEVTILGNNFDRTHEICFGDAKAVTTTLWATNTLVCLLPPSPIAGPVPVTFAHQRQSNYPAATVSSPPVMFRYIDDIDQQLFETCVRVLSEKELGAGVDHRTYAHQIINNSIVQASGGFGNSQSLGFDLNMLASSEKEDILLSILNKIDQNDSPFEPNFDLQQKNGATMLSLACALGYNRLAAGLLARGADPDLADYGGFTPLMIGAMNGHVHTVKRLILKGADTTRRSLNGYVAADFAKSIEISAALRRVRHHLRTSSAGTPLFRSRTNSATSTRSLWGPPSSSASSSMFTTEDESAVESDDDDDADPIAAPSPVLLRSRRNSAALPYSRRGSAVSPGGDNHLIPTTSADAEAGLLYPYAVMAAWRENLAAQIQLFQQNAPWTLPNIQLPALPPLNIPAMSSLQEQHFPSWRRLSALVPNRPTFLSSQATPIPAGEDHEEDSESTASPPPAYGEIFPENADMPLDTKPPQLTLPLAEISTSTQSAGQSTTSHAQSSQTVAAKRQSLQRARKRSTLKIGKSVISEEQVAEIRQLRKESLTSARDDRNLWYGWFPLLILLVFWWYSGLRIPSIGTWTAVGGRAFWNGGEAQPIAVE